MSMLLEQRELIGEPKGEDRIRVLMVEPHKAPYTVEVSNKLETFQKLVGGLIEAVYFDDDSVGGYCNDGGKLLGLPANRRLYGDVICGNFVIFGHGDDGANVSLTDEQVEKYTEMFKEPEVISQDEIRAASGLNIFLI